MDRDFGLIHVRVQTWFPLQIQVYLNGHEWLARKLSANHIGYTKHDSAFVWIEDMARAQRFADRFANLNWPTILGKYATRVTPQLQDILRGRQHYWVSAQSACKPNHLKRLASRHYKAVARSDEGLTEAHVGEPHRGQTRGCRQ